MTPQLKYIVVLLVAFCSAGLPSEKISNAFFKHHTSMETKNLALQYLIREPNGNLTGATPPVERLF